MESVPLGVGLEQNRAHDGLKTVWSPVRRILFRFIFSYLALYCVELLALSVFFVTYDLGKMSGPFTAVLWHHAIPWIGRNILRLHTPITVFMAGSSDTTYNWVLVLTELVIAAVVALIWTGLDRRRPNYRTLYAWIRLAVRTMLAAMLLAYGLDKVIPVQFHTYLSLLDLSRSLGTTAPAGLLWAFMAASPAYTILTGLLETIAGILLLFPEGTAIGALLGALAMGQVFVLNMAYDFGEKQLSFHFLLLSLFLMLPQVPGLVNMLVLNRRTEPVSEAPLSSRRWVRATARIVPPVFGCFLVLIFCVGSLKRLSVARGDHAQRNANYGVWRATSFRAADDRQPLITEKISEIMKVPMGQGQWKSLILESQNHAVVQLGNDVYDWVEWKDDAKTGATLVTDHDGDPAWGCVLALTRIAPDRLHMTGTINRVPVDAEFQREDIGGYILVNRGFHWVTEDIVWSQ